MTTSLLKWLGMMQPPSDPIEASLPFYRCLRPFSRQWVRLRFNHVKGHSGNPWNELADRLAANGISNVPMNIWQLDNVIDDPNLLHQVAAISSVLSGNQLWQPYSINDQIYITEPDRPYHPIEVSFSSKGPEKPIRSGDSLSISVEAVFGTMNVLSLDPEEMRSKISCGLVETGRMLLLQIPRRHGGPLLWCAGNPDAWSRDQGNGAIHSDFIRFHSRWHPWLRVLGG